MNTKTTATDGPAAGLRGDPPATVLNVNDDDANRYSLTRMLRKAGFVVKEAATGADALRMVAERPDLVVLDVQLPDIDGFEVCRRIKQDPATAGIPVLHLSAKFVRDEDRTQGLESGADGYLVHPVEQPELVATVRSLLRLREAERAARANAERVEQLEKELDALERLAAPPATEVTSRAYGSAPLREVHPDVCRELVLWYERLMDLAVERQQYKVRRDVSDELRSMGDRLGFLRAGPRDVVDVYTAALKAKTAAAPAPKARAYIEEGRLLVLELMGHLVSYYRAAAAPPARPRRGPAEERT